MKWKHLIIIVIFMISLFLGKGFDVSAESYIASSAPDEIYTNLTAYHYGVKYSNIWNGKNRGNRDALLVNDSFVTAGVGSRLDFRYITWSDIFNGYIYDSHTLTDYKYDADNDVETVTPGDKIFTVDTMYYGVCWLGIYIGSSANTTSPTYCKYRKVEESVDYGIVYIIANAESYLNKNGINTSTRPNGNLELSWFTQVAIWKYQDINGFSSISMTSNDIKQHVPPQGEENFNKNKVETKNVSSSAVTLWNLADGLVSEAKKNDSSLTLHYDGNYSIEEGSKVKTTLISTSTGASISSYSLDLSKAPSGTKVYNESNTEITDLSNIPSNTKFYLEIPIDNIENFTYDFNVTATATVGNYKGYKYRVSRESERVEETLENTKSAIVLVTGEPQQTHSTIEVKASHIEDSASSISKVIYIGGIFILLCGVGIVYFNIKPKKQEI